MAVTNDNSAIFTFSSATTTITFSSYAMGTGSDRAMVLFVFTEGQETMNTPPAFNTTENFTLIDEQPSGGGTNDIRGWAYKLLSPTETTADVAFTLSSSNPGWAYLRSYFGVSDVLEIDSVQNRIGDASATCVLGSGGASGDGAILAASHNGQATPISDNQSFTQLETGTTGGGGVSLDFSYRVSEDLSLSAATAITSTASGTDAVSSNSGIYLQLQAASSGPTGNPAYYQLLRRQ